MIVRIGKKKIVLICKYIATISTISSWIVVKICNNGICMKKRKLEAKFLLNFNVLKRLLF